MTVLVEKFHISLRYLLFISYPSNSGWYFSVSSKGTYIS